MNLDPNSFEIREQDGLRLITPSHAGAVGNGPWTKDTIKYRSRVETQDGKTVSQGFFKFFNLGTGPESLSIKATDIATRIGTSNPPIATLKLDGSLLIRSERDGKVTLRTRGSFGYDHLDNAYEMAQFFEKYPKLFQANRTGREWYKDVSLLFEWVTPNNQIVIKYKEPELYLIGAVDHLVVDGDTSAGDVPGPYYQMFELEDIASDLGMPLVPHFKLDAQGWEDLQAELDKRQDIEGYVIRLNHDQDLVKVKCIPYLTKHALKSTLTTEKLADLWFQWGRPSYEAFYERFVETFDEETFLWAQGAISALFEGTKAYKKIYVHMQEKAAEYHHSGYSRKDTALLGLREYGQTKRFSLFMKIWEGLLPKQDLEKSVLLQNTKQVELGMFKHTSEEES